jgi:hypothetical protein
MYFEIVGAPVGGAPHVAMAFKPLACGRRKENHPTILPAKRETSHPMSVIWTRQLRMLLQDPTHCVSALARVDPA